MSGYDYDGDGGNIEDDDEYEIDDEFPPHSGPSESNSTKNNHIDFRNSRYSNAYGDYRGGYGPGGGFGPPGHFRPPPPKFPPPQMVWGRGFGPDGPPIRKNFMDKRVIKYLLGCGVPKENLKNLPHKLLNQIEPSNCGLCCVALESYTTSRMHYVSKNHLKNQKKWFIQYSEGAFHSSREAPLKARSLYCELCNVEITSKSHAKSHYDGKPHRAIVEGHKNPRNPVLLQNGMERRLEQLIRREKKFLKSVDQVPAVVEEPKTPKVPHSPDLYCDICKTSVSCTEQMIMHLNGKRHLSKEKQHILKMMKSSASETDTAEAATAEDEGDGQEDDEEQDFNWGQGEERWEEDTTDKEQES